MKFYLKKKKNLHQNKNFGSTPNPICANQHFTHNSFVLNTNPQIKNNKFLPIEINFFDFNMNFQ